MSESQLLENMLLHTGAHRSMDYSSGQLPLKPDGVTVGGLVPVAGRLVKGWRVPNSPYRAPTFILTHYERAPLAMEGWMSFYFVSGEIEEALRRAKRAAGDKDVKIGGGWSTRSRSTRRM